MYYVFVEHKKTRSFNLCNFEELLECNRHYHKARQLNASIPSKTRNREGGEREREGGREANVRDWGKRNGGGGTVTSRPPEKLTPVDNKRFFSSLLWNG